MISSKENQLARHRPETFNESYYIKMMDSSLPDKESRLLPQLVYLPHGAQVLSIGAGSGILEHKLAQIRPDIQTISIDNDFLMAETIQRNQEQGYEVDIVMADAIHPPFKRESFDAIVASSVNHEIASFASDYDYSANYKEYIKSMLQLLKPNGKLLIRDFAGAQNPDQISNLRIGQMQDDDKMSTIEFIVKFAQKYQGLDTSSLISQITQLYQTNNLQAGAILNLPNNLIHEIILHYSWHKNFDHEVQERYTYLSPDQEIAFIQELATELGIEISEIEAYQYTQDGYPEHVMNRFDILDEAGNVQDFIATTQVVSIQKA